MQHRIIQAQQPRMLPASQSQLQPLGSAYPPGYLAQLAQLGGAEAQLEYPLEEYVDEYPPLIQGQGRYLAPPSQVQQYAQPQQYAQQPQPQQQAYSQQPTYPSQLAAQQMLAPQIADLIAQMQQQSDSLARGLGQTHQYAYTDQAGRQVKGIVSTQAWGIPVDPTTILHTPQPQFQPQPHSEKREGGYNVSAQMAGMIAMVTGLLIMLGMISLNLSHSQGVNDGLERANTTGRF